MKPRNSAVNLAPANLLGRLAQLLFLLVPILPPSSCRAASTAKPLDRRDCFFGISIEFHANKESIVGEATTREYCDRVLDTIRPDWVAVDSKGHGGIASYPTRFANRSPHIRRDHIAVWREATRARGLPLLVHYVTILERDTLERHPDWAALDHEGKPHLWRRTESNVISFASPYIDELVIPQVVEMIDRYDLDGIWVDGDNWGAQVDYSDHMVRAWQAATGATARPPAPGQPGYADYAAFNRAAYRRYLAHYVDAFHRRKPGFAVGSNMAYSFRMPEPVAAAVDYLTQDFGPDNTYNNVRLFGRVFAAQGGRPWDFDIWTTKKTAAKLNHEVAGVVALGGAVQFFMGVQSSGEINAKHVEALGEVQAFARPRQPLCHRGRSVPQVGLVYPASSLYELFDREGKFYNGNADAPRGHLQALLDNQLAVDAVLEHATDAELDAHPLLVFPQWDYCAPALRARLLGYAERGGTLLVAGSKAVRDFAAELGVEWVGEPAEQALSLPDGDGTRTVRARRQGLRLRPGTTELAAVVGTPVTATGTRVETGARSVAATVRPLGRGRIAGLAIDLGSNYRATRAAAIRDWLGGLAHKLFPAPLVSVTGSHTVDVVPLRQNGRLVVNLLNSGEFTAELAPVAPLEAAIRLPRAPRKVTLQPEGRDLDCVWADGVARVRVPGFAVHAALVVEEGAAK
jgi:hypothetical protein